MSTKMECSKIDKLMDGPLMTWFLDCVDSKEEKPTYYDLLDGRLIHQVYCQMELHVKYSDEIKPTSDPAQRSRNLKQVLQNLRYYYEDVREHMIFKIPNAAKLALEPDQNVQELELLLCLLLGCAVTCPKKEHYILKIQQYDETIQASLAEYICQIDSQFEIMMSLESLHSHAKADTVNLENMAKVYNRIRQIYLQRNSLLDRVRIITRKMREQSADISSMFDEDEMNSSFYEMLECSFNEHQIDADLRVKVMRQRQCIEHLSTELDVCRDELLQSKEKLAELKKENESLVTKAQLVKSLQDDLDEAKEKAVKVDQLEQDIKRFKHKLDELNCYKTQVHQLKENNEKLLESKEFLEEQLIKLEDYKKKASKVFTLEKHIEELKKKMSDLTSENESIRELYHKKIAESSAFESNLKACLNETHEISLQDESDEMSSIFLNSSISEQLSQSLQSQNLKRELEYRRLSVLEENVEDDWIKELGEKLEKYETGNDKIEDKNTLKRSPKDDIPKTHGAEFRALIDSFEPGSKVKIDGSNDTNDTEYKKVLKECDHLKYQSKCDKGEIEELHNAVEELRAKMKLVEEERDALKEAHEENRYLAEELRVFKMDMSSLQSEHSKEIEAKNKAIHALNEQVSRLKESYEELSQMKSSLESENKMISRNMSEMLESNHQLIVQLIESRERSHKEELRNNEKLNQLNRQKEKLEQKIMDHYKNMANTTVTSAAKPKKSNIIKSAYVRLRRAGPKILNKSRPSWLDEPSSSTNISSEFEFVRYASSSSSLPDEGSSAYPLTPRNRKSVDFLDNFDPDKFSFGGSCSRKEPKCRKSIDFMKIFNKEYEDEQEASSSESDNLKLSNHYENVFMDGTTSVDLSCEELDFEYESDSDVKSNDPDVTLRSNGVNDRVKITDAKRPRTRRGHRWDFYRRPRIE